MSRTRLCLTVCALLASVAACAPPPVTLYVLGAAGGGAGAEPGTTRAGPMVIELARLSLPDYLDNEDIVVRQGSTLQVSHTGRWASRLPEGATALIAARLAQTRPGALVTRQPQMATPAYRIRINISRFDVAAAGSAVVATLDADWLIIPGDPDRAPRRDRTQLSASGPGGSDQNGVAIQTSLLSRLADAIDITRLP